MQLGPGKAQRQVNRAARRAMLNPALRKVLADSFTEAEEAAYAEGLTTSRGAWKLATAVAFLFGGAIGCGLTLLLK